MRRSRVQIIAFRQGCAKGSPPYVESIGGSNGSPFAARRMTNDQLLGRFRDRGSYASESRTQKINYHEHEFDAAIAAVSSVFFIGRTQRVASLRLPS